MLSSMKEWLTKLTHSPDTEVDLSRRRVLKGAAGLAAVAVIASAGGFKLLTEDENSRLIDMIKSGRVEGQTFYLDRTAVLSGLRGLVITNCTFIAAPGFEGNSLLELQDCQNIYISKCYFQCKEIEGNSTALQFKQS